MTAQEPGQYVRNHPHFLQGRRYTADLILDHLDKLEDGQPAIDNYVTFPVLTTEQIRKLIKELIP